MKLLIFVIYSTCDVNCYDNVLYGSLFHDIDTRIYFVPSNDKTLSLIRQQSQQQCRMKDHYTMIVKSGFVTNLNIDAIKKLIEALHASDKKIILLSNEGDYSDEGDVCRISQAVVNSFTKVYACDGRIRAWDRCFICKSELLIGDTISGFAFAWPSPFVKRVPEVAIDETSTFTILSSVMLIIGLVTIFVLYMMLRSR